jgi:hypothetical protein
MTRACRVETRLDTCMEVKVETHQEECLGNFISVYSEEPQQLAAVASKSDAVLAEIQAKNQNASTEPEERSALARLIAGDFASGEQPDGHHFVRAFRAACNAYASSPATVEIYLDEDQFPEMWEFVWGAAEVPCGLPASEFGSPAAGYWDTEGVKRYLGIFANLDFETVAARNNGTSYKEEIAELREVLNKSRRGVYVFYEE